MPENELIKVGIAGAGAWGTALAIIANRAGSKTTLWTRNENVYSSISKKRSNDIYLPDIFIDPAIEITDDLQHICRSDILVLCIPAQQLRAVCIALSDMVERDLPLVIASKGIERGSLSLMSEVVSSILPDNPVAVISGPNFAKEAAAGKPTATTIACEDAVLGSHLVYALGGKYFRPYVTDDLMGVQIGGAVKNVIAIACGIAEGRELGENAKAALITRGLIEMSRLAKAKNGRDETMMGLAGIGDLVLTCSSRLSRNFSLGVRLGEGMTVEQALSSRRRGVTEGVDTAESVHILAGSLNVSMPICRAVYDILTKDADISKTIQMLMERPFVFENHQTSV